MSASKRGLPVTARGASDVTNHFAPFGIIDSLRPGLPRRQPVAKPQTASPSGDDATSPKVDRGPAVRVPLGGRLGWVGPTCRAWRTRRWGLGERSSLLGRRASGLRLGLLALAALAGLTFTAHPALASDADDAVFGEPAAETPPTETPPTETSPDDADVFGDGPDAPKAPSFEAVREDPLAIGGQLYIRLAATFSDRGSLGDQRLAMPNLLDLYLDARPEDRVRGFFSGRLAFDPSIDPTEEDLLGGTRDKARVILDQLWLKTDIARRVFLTVGQERIKWGAGRLWNPNDFLNARRKDPLTLFDERTGVPMLKVHIPWETLNVYVIGLLGESPTLDAPGAAFRVEGAFGATELALSGVAGKNRKTAFGFDLSTALGPFDLTAEVSLSDERDTARYSGNLNFETLEVPTETPWNKWMPRVSAGLQYAFKPNDDDVVYVGLEYFWNPLGEDDASLYPWRLLRGDFEPFYLGQHYLGLVASLPQPGSWDDSSFTFAGLGNLSDESFIARVDYSQTLHTRLRLEAYAQGHFGTRGGELRFAIDLPTLPAIPDLLPEGLDAVSVPAPALLLGLNLRLAI